jgi:hypothetical protein
VYVVIPGGTWWMEGEVEEGFADLSITHMPRIPADPAAPVGGCGADTAGDGERITHPSELKDLEWASFNCVYGYPLLGKCRVGG